MTSSLRQCVRIATACFLAGMFAVPPSLLAQVHVVPPSELHNQLLTSGGSRQRNLDTLDKLFSSEKAQKALTSAGIDSQQVKSAVSALDDQELARLAARADKTQADFAAGKMNDHDLLIVLIAIAALILIIVAVHH